QADVRPFFWLRSGKSSGTHGTGTQEWSAVSDAEHPTRRGSFVTRPARLAVGVISAGRVGSVLGAALDRAGHPVVAASGISAESVRRAEALLAGVPLLPADEVARRADLVLLAVPDDELADVVGGLVDTGSLRAGQIVVHTSGAHGVGVLAQATEH